MITTTDGRQHTARVLAAVQSKAPSASPIAQSWRRCASALQGGPSDQSRPPVVPAAELARLALAMKPVQQAASAVIERLLPAVIKAGCAIVITDATGTIIDRHCAFVDGGPFNRHGLRVGSNWSEASEGTNSIGTCLIEERMITVSRDEHYLSRNIALTGIAAPVFDAKGRIIASFGVWSHRADVTEAYLALLAITIGEGARRIETEAFRARHPKARIMLAPVKQSPSNALLAVTANDLVYAATPAACAALGVPQSTFDEPVVVAMLMEDGPCAEPELILAERGALERALARSNGNVSAAAKYLGISRATFHRKLRKTADQTS
jgi:transcriptional regulator of acetoin/glycerol metabolism